MPLERSSSEPAFKRNVKTLMGEVGHSPHVQSRAQALAISYAIKRRGKAFGGAQAPWFVRSEARNMVHSGPVLSSVGGRTDHHPVSVPSGSYVFPSSHVSSLGQDNTLSGVNVLSRMFKMGPYSSGPSAPIAHGRLPGPPRIAHAAGGDSGGSRGRDHIGQPTPVAIAGGEFVVPPDKILQWMSDNGMKPDLKLAHEAFDKWVISRRKEHVKTLKSLPPPVKS